MTAPEKELPRLVSQSDQSIGAIVRCFERTCGVPVISVRVVPLHSRLFELFPEPEPTQDDHRGLKLAAPSIEPTGNPQSPYKAVLPLMWEDDPIAVIYALVGKSASKIDGGALHTVCDFGALALQGLIERHSDRTKLARLRDEVRFAGTVLPCSSVAEVATVTVQFWKERAGTPAAIWVLDQKSDRMVLAASVGVDVQALAAVSLWSLPSWDKCLPREKKGARGMFATVSKSDEVSVAAFDRMLLMAATPGALPRSLLRSMLLLLEPTISRCGHVDAERRRSREVEAGMAIAIHEVRGSLLAVRNAIGIVRRRGGLELLDRAKMELEKNSALADTLLRYFRGFDDLDIRSHRVARIIGEAVESCLLESGPREVRVSGPAHLEVDADEHLLRSAIVNVVRNALSYSPNDAPVDVTFREFQESVEIRTVAPGPRISTDEHDHLFEPFFRGRHRKKSTQGFGLGLFLARKVVEAHNGSIHASSRDGLTSFVIELPRSRRPADLEKRPAPLDRSSVA